VKHKITKLEDIATLPWTQTSGPPTRESMELGAEVEAFILKQTDPEVQKEAIRLLIKHSTGYDAPVDDHELEGFLGGATWDR
jgi:hypothetical protein